METLTKQWFEQKCSSICNQKSLKPLKPLVKKAFVQVNGNPTFRKTLKALRKTWYFDKK
jgi:hypothetical protein